LFSSSSPAPEPLTDEVVAILLTTHNQKMSLVELTKAYNQAFRSQGPKRDGAELLQAVRKLPNFKVKALIFFCEAICEATSPTESKSSTLQN
jgi:hypothetical protein